MGWVPKEYSAAERARWLAELAKALVEAVNVAAELGLAQSRRAEHVEFFARVTVARAQVRSLRLGQADERTGECSPNWSNPAPWPSKSGERR
ncbi:hypothetical protein ACUXST_002299 [Sphingomonas sp. F9_3S_D5_B_2]